jgi:hypothetical protein
VGAAAKEGTMTVTVQSQDEAQIRQLLAEGETAMRARDAERLTTKSAT